MSGMDFKRLVRAKKIAFALLRGAKYVDMAEELGLSRGHFYTIMKDDRYKILISKYLDEIGEELKKIVDEEERKKYIQYV